MQTNNTHIYCVCHVLYPRFTMTFYTDKALCLARKLTCTHSCADTSIHAYALTNIFKYQHIHIYTRTAIHSSDRLGLWNAAKICHIHFVPVHVHWSPTHKFPSLPPDPHPPPLKSGLVVVKFPTKLIMTRRRNHRCMSRGVPKKKKKKKGRKKKKEIRINKRIGE